MSAPSASARRRKALREFYKLQQQQQQQDSGANDSALDDSDGDQREPGDLDKSGSVDEYIRNLVREGDLKTLVKTENELSGEIRELESEQKTLVYNNYNKLISAANALESMHSSTELGQFDDLKASFEKISRVASKVSETAFVRASRPPTTNGPATPGQIQTARWLLYVSGPGLRKEGKLEGDVAVRLIDSIPKDGIADSLRHELQDLRKQFAPQETEADAQPADTDA